MGRQYVDVKVCSDDRCSEWVRAFIDTGADLTVISTEISEKLGIVLENIEREWAASDGDELCSPIAQVEIIEDGGGVVTIPDRFYETFYYFLGTSDCLMVYV